MDHYLNKDRVIGIKDYYKYVLSHWIILVLFVLFFSLLSSAAYIMKTKKTNLDMDRSDLIESSYSQLSDLEKGLVNNAVSNFQDYCQSILILNNSVISQINPYCSNKVCLVYNVSYDGESERVSEANNAEINLVSSNLYYYCYDGGLAQDVSEILGYEPQYIADCFDPEEYIVDSGCISLTIYGGEVVPELPDVAEICIDEYLHSIDTNNVTVELASVSNSTVRSTYVFTLQKGISDGLKTIKNRFDESIQIMSDQGRYCFELIASGINPDVFQHLYNGEIMMNSVFSVKGLVKYIVVGAILGIMSYLLIVLVRFMFSPKIVSNDDYTGSVGIDLLGTVKNDLSDIGLIITKLNHICEKECIRSIAFISTDPTRYEKCIDLLNKGLIQKDRTVSYIVNYMNDNSSYEKILKMDCCLMIEGRNSSLLKKVSETVSFCKDNDIRIIGVVSIDDKAI